jgi:hypothetical protein
VNRVVVPCLHQFAELALPVRERPPARRLGRAELGELVEGELGVDGVAVEVRNFERGRAEEDERAHRGGVEPARSSDAQTNGSTHLMPRRLAPSHHNGIRGSPEPA